jgi:hypothetical protein
VNSPCCRRTRQLDLSVSGESWQPSGDRRNMVTAKRTVLPQSTPSVTSTEGLPQVLGSSRQAGIFRSVFDLGGKAWPGFCGWLMSAPRARGGAGTSWKSSGPTISPRSSGLLISMMSTQGPPSPAAANFKIHSTPHPRSKNRSENIRHALAPPILHQSLCLSPNTVKYRRKSKFAARVGVLHMGPWPDEHDDIKACYRRQFLSNSPNRSSLCLSSGASRCPGGSRSENSAITLMNLVYSRYVLTGKKLATSSKRFLVVDVQQLDLRCGDLLDVFRVSRAEATERVKKSALKWLRLVGGGLCWRRCGSAFFCRCFVVARMLRGQGRFSSAIFHECVGLLAPR